MDARLGALILFLVTSTASHRGSLSCEDTTQRTLVRQVNCILDGESIWCSSFTNETLFRILGQVHASQTTVTFCLGLEHFYSRTHLNSKQNLFIEAVNFNSSLPVGVATVRSTCWEMKKSAACLDSVTVFEEVLDLGVFKYPPYREEFWNFESTLYGTTMDWFLSMNIEGRLEPCSISSQWITNLYNTSIRELTVSCGKCDDENYEFLLKDMPYLRKLHLFSFCIKSFHKDSFSGTSNIEDVILNVARLTFIPFIITRLPKLQKLEFSYNEFHDFVFIEDKILSQLGNLEYLSMNGSIEMSVLNKFPVFPKLKMLSLRQCEIKLLERDAFRNISLLETLDLSFNHITSIHEEAFLSLRNLKYLYLYFNLLTTWPVIYYCSLLYLNIEDNQLTGFTNPSDYETTIDYLRIRSNNISAWDDSEVFSYKGHLKVGENNVEGTELYIPKETYEGETGKKWVRILDISVNYITRFTDIMLKSMDGLEEVILLGNPLDCSDCTIPGFQTWINTTKTNIATVSSIRCSAPNKGDRKSVIDIEFDLGTCIVKGPSYWLLVGIPLCIGSLVFIAFISTYIRFRPQIVYMLHLYRIRKQKTISKTECNFDAFVCYSSRDRRFVVTVLAPLLEKCPERYKLCLLEREFALGSHIVDNIVGAIESSRKTILILSQHFINSKWCIWELEMANSKMFDGDKEFLILIQVASIDRDKIPHHLKFLMDTRMSFTCTQDTSEGAVQYMGRQLKKCLGKSIFQSKQDVLPAGTPEIRIV